MKSKTFIISFLFGVISFIALNIYSYTKAVDPMCSLPVEFGVPFTSGTFGGFITTTQMLWSGIIANGLVALGSSFIFAWAVVKIRRAPKKMP